MPEFSNFKLFSIFATYDMSRNRIQIKYCANDVIYLHKIHSELEKILTREKRIALYKDCLKFLKTRVDLDLASFREDIWSH